MKTEPVTAVSGYNRLQDPSCLVLILKVPHTRIQAS
jgi:hypothetical protein